MTDRKIVPFLFDGEKMIRAIVRDGEELWIGKDWASALGYRDTAKAIAAHCRHGRALGGVGDLPTPGLDPQTIVIPEGDVWRLILRSKLPDAQRMERWLMDTVLPTLRSTGTYQMPGTDHAHEGEIVAKEDLTTLPIQTKINLANLCCRVWGQPATQEMYEYLKLPPMPSMVMPSRQPRLDLGDRAIVAFRPPPAREGA